MTDLLFHDREPTLKKLNIIMQIRYELKETEDEHFCVVCIGNPTLNAVVEDIRIPKSYQGHLRRFLWRHALFMGIESNIHEKLDADNRRIIKRYISYMDAILAALIQGCRGEKGVNVYYRSKTFDLYLVVEFFIGRHDYQSGDQWRRTHKMPLLETVDVMKLGE